MIEISLDDGIDPLAQPDWGDLVDRAGTVFHRQEFLTAWWRDHSRKDESASIYTLRIIDGDELIGGCVLTCQGDHVSFAGGSDVTDYMGPISLPDREDTVAAAVYDTLVKRLAWRQATLAGLDSTNAATESFVRAVTTADATAQTAVYDSAPRITEAPGGFIAHLNAKRRAEVRRKRERLVEMVGELSLVDSDATTLPEFVDRLLTWKSKASNETEEFVIKYGDFVRDMTRTLTETAAAGIVELRGGEGQSLASAITLTHGHIRYLYNMSFDAQLVASLEKRVSPGAVLVAELAEAAIDSGRSFDFLRGAQDYKLRLGGVPQDLKIVTLRR